MMTTIQNFFKDMQQNEIGKYRARRYHDTELITAGVFFLAVHHGYQGERSTTRDLLLTFAVFRLLTYLAYFYRIMAGKTDAMFEIIMDLASLVPVLAYFLHFFNSYWDGYDAPLPQNEVCRKELYCGVAVFFKWFVFVAIGYYLLAFAVGLVRLFERGGGRTGEWLRKLFNNFTQRENRLHYYVRRYFDMDLIISLAFIIGFNKRPRERTSETALLLLFFAISRLAAWTLNILQTAKSWANVVRYKLGGSEMNFNIMNFVIEVASYILMVLYLFNFIATYKDWYNAPLPHGEVCTGGIYCGMAVFFKWYVFLTALYYAAWAAWRILEMTLWKMLKWAMQKMTGNVRLDSSSGSEDEQSLIKW